MSRISNQLLRDVQHGEDVHLLALHPVHRDVMLVQYQILGAIDAAGAA